jgi:hypothetical protein
MANRGDESGARRIATPFGGLATILLGVAILVVGACNDDRDHPPFVPPCGPLDAAVGDAGPDAGPVVVSCGNQSNVPVGGVAPGAGGPSGNNGGQPVIGIGGAPGTGAGGSPGVGAGGTGAFGGTNGLGAGGFFQGIGGAGVGATGVGGAGTGVGATSPGGAGTGIGVAGDPFGAPGIGGGTF